MRERRFLSIFLAIWLSLLVTTLIGYFAFAWEATFVEDIVRRIVLPLAILFSVNIVISVIASLIIYFVLYKDERQLEAKLRALIARKYDSPIFSNETNGLYTNQTVNQTIINLRDALQNMDIALQSKTLADEATTQMNQNELVKKERQRIARELHDSVSQQLFAMTMLLSAIQEQGSTLDPVNRQLIAKVADMVDQAQSEMRALLLHLRPISLTNQTLAEGIEQLFRELETKVKINFEAKVNDVQLQAEIEDHLFRIVQELMSNSMRHAQPDMIECQLYEKDRNIYLRFSDDGIGFDTETELTGNSGGYGLKNIHERVTQLGGTVSVISFENQGTLVQIVVPKKMEENDD